MLSCQKMHGCPWKRCCLEVNIRLLLHSNIFSGLCECNYVLTKISHSNRLPVWLYELFMNNGS